jgi:hypothetical protein
MCDLIPGNLNIRDIIDTVLSIKDVICREKEEYDKNRIFKSYIQYSAVERAKILKVRDGSYFIAQYEVEFNRLV